MSEQMRRLLDRYDVTNEQDLLIAIRKDYEQETGEQYSETEIMVILDRMLEAEYQRIAGGAYDEEV